VVAARIAAAVYIAHLSLLHLAKCNKTIILIGSFSCQNYSVYSRAETGSWTV
jgi:hypothetical protein